MDPAPDSPEITQLLAAWQAGDTSVEGALIDAVYQELKWRARRYLRGERAAISMMTTDLVHDVYLRLSQQSTRWSNRNHFFGVASVAMRRLLVDRARARHAQKRGGRLERTDLTGKDFADPLTPTVLALDDALSDLEKLDPRKSKILELRYFTGLENRQIAEVFDVSKSTVERDLRLAKAWLKTYLEAIHPAA